MGQYDTTINIMLFEGGAVIGSLHGNTQSQRLADKIELADRAAFAAGKTDFDLSLDPVEIGIAIQALDGASADLAKSLSEKLRQALGKLMSDAGIAYGSAPQSGLGEQPSPTQGLGGDTSQQGSEPQPSDGTSPSDGLGAPSSDGSTEDGSTQPAASEPPASEPASDQPAGDAPPSDGSDTSKDGPQTP